MPSSHISVKIKKSLVRCSTKQRTFKLEDPSCLYGGKEFIKIQRRAAGIDLSASVLSAKEGLSKKVTVDVNSQIDEKAVLAGRRSLKCIKRRVSEKWDDGSTYY